MSAQDIKVFVPAKAIEFLGNPEHFSMRDKLWSAIKRLHFSGDFFKPAPDEVEFHVHIGKYSLQREPLGYNVEAQIITNES